VNIYFSTANSSHGTAHQFNNLNFFFFLAFCRNNLPQSNIQFSSALLCFPIKAETVPYTGYLFYL